MSKEGFFFQKIIFIVFSVEKISLYKMFPFLSNGLFTEFLLWSVWDFPCSMCKFLKVFLVLIGCLWVNVFCFYEFFF